MPLIGSGGESESSLIGNAIHKNAPNYSYQRVLVTGATGYIGGRLVPRLLEKGHHVRCVARNPQRLEGHAWPGVEIVPGDLEEPSDFWSFLEGIDVAYYLMHSMAAGRFYRERDRRMARSFAEAAERAGVKRIIYLGSLGEPDMVHSPHLLSRQEVGRWLASRSVPVLEFRAAVIVGSGSASFEMIRHLVDRLPVMIVPNAINTLCQPIGVRAVLEYLVEALEHPDARGIFEIGGTDVLTYREMMLRYARIRGLRRLIHAFPVPLPKLAGHWVDLITPIPLHIAQPLVESLRTRVVVKDDTARRVFSVRPTGYDDAVRQALARMANDSVMTTWASSLSSLSQEQGDEDVLGEHEGMLLDRKRRRVKASPERMFETICRLGGEEGWLSGNWLWQLRGLMDRMVGGVGMRRGRRHHTRAARGRAARLVARRGAGGTAPAAPARGDEAARARLVAVRGAARHAGVPRGADSILRAQGHLGVRVLVCGASVPPLHLPRNDHRAQGARGSGRGRLRRLRARALSSQLPITKLNFFAFCKEVRDKDSVNCFRNSD